MPPMVHSTASVGNCASAYAPTDHTNRCATPGCTLHAVVRATVDVHFTRIRPLPFGYTRATRLVTDHCLPCYGRLRQGQTDAYLEIVAVEPVQ